MATIRILLGIAWFAIVGSSWRTGSSSINDGREKVLAIAKKEIGVQETMENSGVRVDQYNVYAGLKKVPWCASFISWVFGQAGYPQPRTAWSPALFPKNRLAGKPVPGLVLGIYFNDLKRIAHCGIVEWTKNSWVGSIEGNTNVAGSREGNGVYRRVRHSRMIYCYADWTGEGVKQ
ncbi:hypothetical protein HDC92_001387 [Pedobacter sp. AK017]|uniref:peptidoglycan-binding protein n=1 Tax=Pedobacter sp. AK017 TaxID=2723073 RepID=UPI0016104024|nr:peptidoglycan-binding protein [Pedobacter sp. AK017]MBB5437713.1 hypothetical protein [Pedobacter sp. AK017]